MTASYFSLTERAGGSYKLAVLMCSGEDCSSTPAQRPYARFKRLSALPRPTADGGLTHVRKARDAGLVRRLGDGHLPRGAGRTAHLRALQRLAAAAVARRPADK